jgi:hypothetical protein
VFNLQLSLLALIGLAASIACASPAPTDMTRQRLPEEVASDSAVYPSVEAAVGAAFAAAERADLRATRDRLRIGTIRRVPGGFSWSAPVASRTAVTEMAPIQVRLRFDPQDVAIYGLHPRSGRSELDRSNEVVTRHERRLVDEQDRLHRPLYVLTPSRRIVRYPDVPESVELVRREEGSGR